MAHSILFVLATATLILSTLYTAYYKDAVTARQKRSVTILTGKEISPLPVREYFCTDCSVGVDKQTKHCNKCGICIEGFDHHCQWLNICIGRRNYRLFVFANILGLVILVYEIIYLSSMAIPFSQDSSNTKQGLPQVKTSSNNRSFSKSQD